MGPKYYTGAASRLSVLRHKSLLIFAEDSAVLARTQDEGIAGYFEDEDAARDVEVRQYSVQN